MPRFVLIAIAALAIAACSSPPPKAEPKIFDVRIAQVGSQKSAVTISGTGTVRLRRETSLAFTSAGRIARLAVNEGDRVAKGQLLAALDMTTVNAQLDAARAEQTRTAGELKRATALFEQGWVTKAYLENARAAYESSMAASRVRQFATDTARIVAPNNGVVLARTAEPSQTVDAGTPILVLGDESAGYVLRIPVPDRDAARLRPGAPAKVRIASLGDAALDAVIVEIGGRADPVTGTFDVEIALPATPGLRSGQVGSAELIVSDSTGPASLLVPPAALFSPRAGEGFVYVVPQGSKRVALRKVTIAEARDGGVIVTGGLKAGEWVVVSNLDRLADKAQVNPIRRAP